MPDAALPGSVIARPDGAPEAAVMAAHAAQRVLVPAVPAIAVVIPALDEEARIGLRLAELSRTPGIAEVLVVDGGSRDGTAQVARGFFGVRVLTAPRGRASQMNAGARVASPRCEVLLFLHADVSLPADAALQVSEILSESGAVAGAFRTRTVDDSGSHGLRPLLRLFDLRSRRRALPYGDQALFVRRRDFLLVGGFPEQPILEDVELARRLRRRGRIRIARAEVRVSGRRFLQHPFRFTLLVHAIRPLAALGVPLPWLARLWSAVR